MEEKTYNVGEIAILLRVNKGTVRRWIRTGKLEAVKHSNKKGFVVLDSKLRGFARGTKYEKCFCIYDNLVANTGKRFIVDREAVIATLEACKRISKLIKEKELWKELWNDKEKRRKILKDYYGEY